MSRSTAVASSSTSTLESDQLSYPAPSLSGTDTTGEGEPIPTLSSLLLSTAESLVARSNKLPTSTSVPTSTLPAPFTLSSDPPTLLSHPSTQPYLSSLLSQPLPSLLSLPSQLSSLSSSLDSDLSTLAFTRYSSFLLSHSSSLSISNSFSTLSTSLSSLLDSTCSLEQSASEFEERVREIKGKRERLGLVKERLEPLEELLESSKVVEGCVRNGQWNEAIQVGKRIQSLTKRYREHGMAKSSSQGGGGGGGGILDRVGKDVEKALMGLKVRVLESLGDRGLKLPGAVRGVGILRKLNLSTTTSWDEEEGLRIVFLSARWKCFEKELELVQAQMIACGINLDGGVSNVGGKVGVEENDERTRWIKRWIELWREIVGETIGMYTEVFLSSTSSHATSSPASTLLQVDDFLNPSPHLPASAPLELFLSSSLAALSTILRASLPSLTSTASLSSLLTQLTYCSHSFTRYGLSFDIPLQLSSLFASTIERIILKEWELAGKRWEMEWREGWSRSGGTALVTTSVRARRNGRIPIKDWLVVPEGVSNLLSTPLPDSPTTFVLTPASIDGRGGGGGKQDWHHQPCTTLALVPPLAHLLNSYVNSLNSLRLLPPREIFGHLVGAQSKELERASRVLEAFVDAWLGSYQSTPVPAQSSTFSPASTTRGGGGGGAEGEGGMSEEENVLVREREEEKSVVLRAIGWFGREVIPWLRNGLVRGVYSESGEKEEEALVEARKRVERLIARIEGREWVDPDARVEASNSANGVNGQDGESDSNGVQLENGSGVHEEEEEEASNDKVPVLEITAGPLKSLESTSQKSDTNGRTPSLDKPINFKLDAAPLPTDEPSLDSTTSGGEASLVEEKDPHAPYLVDDVAPPLPVPPTETAEILERETERENGQKENSPEGEDGRIVAEVP